VVQVSHLHPLAAKATADAASAWMRNPKRRAFAKVRVHRVRVVMFFKNATEIRAHARLCCGLNETRPRLSSENGMSNCTRYLGLEIHAETIAAAIAEGREKIRSLGKFSTALKPCSSSSKGWVAAGI